MTSAAAETDSVFINCPFDTGYAPTFDAIIFAVMACGFRARSALEVEDGGQTRIEKLYALIEQCRYGIHDLSRTELDPRYDLPRFNMPLELGIWLGASKFGDGRQALKKALIFDVEQYRYQKFASDLNGMDIVAHGGDQFTVVSKTRDWLRNVSRRKLVAGPLVVASYRRFLVDKAALSLQLGFGNAPLPYADYENIVADWLIKAGA